MDVYNRFTVWGGKYAPPPVIKGLIVDAYLFKAFPQTVICIFRLKRGGLSPPSPPLMPPLVYCLFVSLCCVLHSRCICVWSCVSSYVCCCVYVCSNVCVYTWSQARPTDLLCRSLSRWTLQSTYHINNQSLNNLSLVYYCKGWQYINCTRNNIYQTYYIEVIGKPIFIDNSIKKCGDSKGEGVFLA